MRRKNDFYETPQMLTRYLLNHVNISGHVADPCAGKLAISQLIPNCLTNDIDPLMPTDYHMDAVDFMRLDSKHFVKRDWFVMNPPFKKAHEILPVAYDNARIGIAMLLRVTYLEPTMTRNKRGDWLKDNSEEFSHLIIFGNTRPNFIKGGGRG